MSNKPYSYRFQTPFREYKSETDDMPKLIRKALADLMAISATALSNAITDYHKLSGDISEQKIKKAMILYEQKYGNCNYAHSKIVRAGHLETVLACYLQGMSIYKVKSYLKKHFSVETSKTAIGRLWVRFKSLDLANERVFGNTLN
jgi:hypothetical protein